MYGTRDAGFFGYSHFTGGFAGGQAEYVRVPFGEVNCLVVPDELKMSRRCICRTCCRRRIMPSWIPA